MKGTEGIVVLLYMLLLLGIGIYFSRRATRSLEDFYVAGRTIGPFIMGLILFATLNSAGFMIGNIGFVYTYGITLMWCAAAGVLVGGVLAMFFIAKYYVKTGAKTVPEIMNYLYGNKAVTIFSAIILFVGILFYCIAQYKAGGILVDYILGIGYVPSLAIATFIFIFYTALGGKWAVTFTDAIQGTLMFIIALVLPIICMIYFGGPFKLLQSAMLIKPVLGGIFSVPISSYLGLFLAWVGCMCVLPHLIMHALSAKDSHSATWGYAIQQIMYGISVILAWLFVAAAAIVINPELADADTATFAVVNEILSPFIGGVVVAALLAGLMSTTDSMILALSSTFTYDIYNNLKSGIAERKLIIMSSIAVAVIGVITFIISIKPPPILTAFFFDAAGSMAACLFPSIILGIWWKKANHWGALTSMIVGFFAYWIIALGKFLPPWTVITYTMISVFIIHIGVSLITKPLSKEVRRRISLLHE